MLPIALLRCAGIGVRCLLAAVVLLSTRPGMAAQKAALQEDRLPSLSSGALASSNPDASLRVAQQQLKTLTTQPARTRAHVRMAAALLELRRYNEALFHARVAVQQFRTNADSQGVAHTYHLLGSVNEALGDSGQAHHRYQQALEGFTRLNDLRSQAAVNEHLGDLYASQHRWERALVSYQNALKIWHKLREPARISVAMHAIGRMYLVQQQYSRALFYLRQSVQRSQELHDSIAVGYVLQSMGGVYASFGSYGLARGIYTQALNKLPRHHAPPVLQASLYENIAAMYDSTGNLPAAEYNLQQALALEWRAGSKSRLSDLYYSLSMIYRKQGQTGAALEALTRHVELEDSVAAETRAIQIAELRTRYETKKKEQEIELLQKERLLQEANLRRQTGWRNVLGVGALLLLLLVGGLYRARQRQASINRLLTRKNQAIHRQKEELDRLNRTKDTLFSVISHDLRSPLSSLYSLLTLLNLGSSSPQRLAEHSVRVSRALDATLHLLDNLLNWSMAQLRNEGMKPKVFALDELVEECLTLLLNDAERKDLLFQNHLSTRCFVRADVDMTRLILRNLIGNAIKFTPAGGSISIANLRAGAFWEIAVTDTGVGIPKADWDKVLGIGVRSTLGTDRERGTGLGLRLCKDFVEMNGGKLSFTSELNSGSVFRFTLPAVAKEAHLPIVSVQDEAEDASVAAG
ncbi:tetratricopeptide repeat protein [Hymenobacter sp. DG25A]|uniref:ATP-binding protein n=1 Tax=Hymenobacter sp. DG25A TaxID=1385663 RepID=UPI0006BCD246|nr:tetratricopeptide repeat protein [Hymenobacter sp. DG25A]ALD21389.1 hypothetical protein AM218_09390 [Hymenobacter sp. DG25A]